MLLILIGHPTGIGFLIAAKSILRFGEIKESRHRKLAEYIIIGTFLSFGWALLMSVAAKKAIDHWLPAASNKPDPVKVIIEQASSPATPAIAPSPSSTASKSPVATKPAAEPSPSPTTVPAAEPPPSATEPIPKLEQKKEPIQTEEKPKEAASKPQPVTEDEAGSDKQKADKEGG